MRMILAVIQPTKLATVQAALQRAGVERMTVKDVEGFGRQRGQKSTYRGIEYKVELLRKVQLEILVNEDFLERTLDLITTAARHGPEGEIGDGKVFVVPAIQCIDLASGKSGPGAV